MHAHRVLMRSSVTKLDKNRHDLKVFAHLHHTLLQKQLVCLLIPIDQLVEIVWITAKQPQIQVFDHFPELLLPDTPTRLQRILVRKFPLQFD